MFAGLIFIAFVQAYAFLVLTPGGFGRSLLATQLRSGAPKSVPRNSSLSQQWSRLQVHVSHTAQQVQTLRGELRELRDALKRLHLDMSAQLVYQRNQTQQLDEELSTIKDSNYRLTQEVERLTKRSSWLSLPTSASSGSPIGLKPVSKYDAGNSSLGGWIHGYTWQQQQQQPNLAGEGELGRSNATDAARANSSNPQAWAKKAIAWIMPSKKTGNESIAASAGSFLWFVGGNTGAATAASSSNDTDTAGSNSSSSSRAGSLEAMAQRTGHRFSNKTHSMIRAVHNATRAHLYHHPPLQPHLAAKLADNHSESPP